MKTRTLLALALLVVVGAATVWKVTRPDPHVRAGETSQAYSVKKEDVDELEIAEAGKPAISLKKEGGEWKLTQPVADRADQAAVTEALETLEGLKIRDVIAESPESYEKVGLKDSEVVKLVPKKAGKPLASLVIGKTTNVRLGDDKRVFSTANLKRWTLVKDVKLWRDRSIVDVSVDDIEKIEVAYPTAKVVARKEAPPAPAPDPKADPKATPPAAGPSKWVLAEGADKLGGPLDENVALELASTLSRLMADDFADEKETDKDAGLDPPRMTVTLSMKGGKTITLLVGKEAEEKVLVKLKDRPRIWKIHKWEGDRIPSSPSQWRDKTLLRLEPAEVTKIEVLKDKDRTLLERVDDKTWKVSAPANLGTLDQGRVQAILRTTQALHATRVLDGADPKSVGLDKPKAVVTLFKKDGSSVKIALGNEKDGQTAVQLNGGKDLYELPSHQAQPLVKGSAEFKLPAGGGGGDAHPPM